MDPVNDDIELPQFLDFSDDQLNIGSQLESIIKSEAKKEVKLQGKIENSAQGKLLAGITERRESQNIEKPKTGPVRPKGGWGKIKSANRKPKVTKPKIKTTSLRTTTTTTTTTTRKTTTTTTTKLTTTTRSTSRVSKTFLFS